MLKKAQRFARAAFPAKERVKTRHSFSWGAVSLYERPRFGAGVVVSKKVLGKAHDRNRLRKRLYDAIGRALPTHPSALGVLVFPRKEALTAPHEGIVQDLRGVFSTF